jgi:hypothetical protein
MTKLYTLEYWLMDVPPNHKERLPCQLILYEMYLLHLRLLSPSGILWAMIFEWSHP